MPSPPFLSTEFQPDVNLFDVTEAGSPDATTATANMVFVFVPERSLEIQEVEARFPGGTLRTFEGVYANPLFYAYEAHP
ncbi:MAG: hypothetical protein KC418_11970 [Anaerolineales bacterium]|nr:hypothetical protein [Anaerolineales bacterium]MCB8951355.1 hypothetical protein [Ardenticatenales bacterium]